MAAIPGGAPESGDDLAIRVAIFYAKLLESVKPVLPLRARRHVSYQ